MERKDKGKDMLLGGLIGVGVAALGYFGLKFLSEETATNVNENGNLNNNKNENDLTLEQFENKYKDCKIDDLFLKNSDFLFENMPENYFCTISGDILYDPYMTECGHSFNKKLISKYISTEKKCPICRQECQLRNLKPNYSLKNLVEEKSKKLIKKIKNL